VPARTLTITSDAGELARVRAWLREQLSEGGIDSRTQSGLVAAVGELAANAIKHGYRGQAGQPIHISLESRDDRVVIQIEDFGTPFDPARYREPKLDEANEGGWGLYVAGRLCDELSFDPGRERGTRWQVVKYRSGSRPERSR
jgi:anti-sigma regulatory factor (Ser/Thr protein kinase)